MPGLKTDIKLALRIYSKELQPYLLALIEVESSFNEYALRFEPGYPYLWKPSEFAKAQGITKASEKICQQFSVGLMQVMFATARWQGFDGSFAEFFDPFINIEFGAKYFISKLHDYDHDYESAIAAYNRGSVEYDDEGRFINESYVSRVLEAYLKHKEKTV